MNLDYQYEQATAKQYLVLVTLPMIMLLILIGTFVMGPSAIICLISSAVIAEATEENQRPSLVIFGAFWCPGCVKLDRDLDGNEMLKTYVDLVFDKVWKLNVDKPEVKEIQLKYRMERGIPSIAYGYVTPDRKFRIVDRIYGYSTPQDLITKLQRIRSNETNVDN